jgi:hypothetical protein
MLAASLMVTEKESDELYRPYDTLKAIGFSTDDAKSFLAGIENEAASQIKAEPKSEPDTVVKYSAQRSERRRSRVKGLLLIVWGYAFAVWLYVIAMQLFYPDSLYYPVATWLPIRLDYFGESAFFFSFIVSIAVIWTQRLSLRTGRHPAQPDAASPA